MSTGPHSKADVERRRVVREQPHGWRAIPLAAKILVALCLAVLLLIPLAKQEGWFQRKQVVQTTPEPSERYTSGELEVTTARLNLKTRTIKGTVSNKSSDTYDNVQVSFDVRRGGPIDAGAVYARLGTIPPHSSVNFETTPLSPAADEWELRELSGTKR